MSNFTHGIDTAVGTAGGVNDGTAGSFLTTVGLIDLNHNGNFGNSGDIAVTFTSPIGTFNEANFEARLQYVLTGTSGADTITTGAGNDIITGEAGNDTITGGAGSDQFRLATNSGTDTIDFIQGTDKIGFLNTGSNGNGSVAFNTAGTSNGTVLNANDFDTRATFAAMTNSDNNQIVLITQPGLTTTNITSGDTAGDNAQNTYVIVFNENSTWAKSGLIRIGTIQAIAPW